MKTSHAPWHLSQLHLGGLQVLRQAPQLPRHVVQLVLPTAEWWIDIPWMICYYFKRFFVKDDLLR